MTNAGRFVDCSSNNPIPDLAAYKQAGHTHICRKVSEGVGYHWFEGDAVASRAHQLGLRVGHYHWLRPDSSATAQAAFFVAIVKDQVKPGDWLMADFEQTSGVGDPSDVERAAQLHAFNTYVRQHLPAYPLFVYTGNWYLAGKPHCQAEARNWPIVMSDYSNITTLPNPYRLRYVAWQFTQTATVAGFSGHVDYNRWITQPPLPETEFTVDAAAKARFDQLDGEVAAVRAIADDLPKTITSRVDGKPYALPAYYQGLDLRVWQIEQALSAFADALLPADKAATVKTALHSDANPAT